MSWPEHMIVALLVVVLPLYSWSGYRRLVDRLARGDGGARAEDYRETMVWQWSLVLATCVAWWHAGRPFADLGLTWPSGPWVLPLGVLGALVIAFLHAQLRRVKRHPDREFGGAEDVESLRGVLPETDGEMRLATMVAVTAGICEEILYRGLLIAYVHTYLPLAVAVVVASMLFAWVHIYQGVRPLPKIALVSLAMAGIFVATGSLLLPMLLHAVGDIYGLQTGRALLQRRA